MDAIEHVPDWIIALAAAVTGLGVIWAKAVRPVVKMLNRIEASLVYVEREMHFNGGSTMRDALQRIDVAVRNLDQRLTVIEQNTNHLEEPSP